MSQQRSVTILGATGSVGRSTLDLIDRNRDDFRIEALTAGVLDPEYLVRYHCATTLLRYAGEETELSELPVFAEILDEPTADAATRHARAATALAARANGA